MGAEELTDTQKDLMREYIERYSQEQKPREFLFSAQDLELRERILRVESSIETQIMLTRQLMEQVDKRFDIVQKQLYWLFSMMSAVMLTTLGALITLILK